MWSQVGQAVHLLTSRLFNEKFDQICQVSTHPSVWEEAVFGDVTHSLCNTYWEQEWEGRDACARLPNCFLFLLPTVIRGGPLDNPYRLKQFHFHWGEKGHHGSEHTVAGLGYASEVRVLNENISVCQSLTNNLAGASIFLWFWLI